MFNIKNCLFPVCATIGFFLVCAKAFESQEISLDFYVIVPMMLILFVATYSVEEAKNG